MDADELRRRFDHLLGAGGMAAARAMLLEAGAQVGGGERTPHATLETVLQHTAVAPAGDERRAFAVLLVHALRVPGLVRSGTRRTALDQAICAFLEAALLNALRRAGYSFGAPVYDRLRFLEALYTTIDEHLRPLEPSIPIWLHGLRR